MAGTCRKGGRQQRSEANAIWQTRRKKGRQRLKWLDDVKEDLREREE
jgi:hypothetical protein